MRKEKHHSFAEWVAVIVACIGSTVVLLNMIGLVFMVYYSIYRIIFK